MKVKLDYETWLYTAQNVLDATHFDSVHRSSSHPACELDVFHTDQVFMSFQQEGLSLQTNSTSVWSDFLTIE